MNIVAARPTRRTTLAVGVVLTLLVALSGYLIGRASGESTSTCDRRTTAMEQRLAHDSGSGKRVVVIGDSYSVGNGLDTPFESWPSRLRGHVHVSGFAGSGFAAHPCGDTSYGDRAAAAVRRGARLVVVEGGLNDTGASDAAMWAGFNRLMAALDGLDVLVVGPPPAPERGLPVRHVDALLARMSTAHDVGYLSMLHVDLPYLEDDLHLTPAGHVAFGNRVARAVRRR